MEIEEAALTGESTPVLKDVTTIDRDEVPLGDRLCMVFMNTSVTRGRGELIVTGTGMDTEIGSIADLLNKTEADKTPLQKQLDRLTVVIAGLAGVAFVAMILLGLANDQDFDDLFLAGVALAVSAIPTGLPAVVTTLYSTGTRVLAGQNAIVKRLPSVETLGSVSAICSDKTGTLTLNKMTARELVVPGQNRFSISGEGYGIEGQIRHEGGATIDLTDVLLPMALCADARLADGELIGDPTEGALIVLAAKGGIDLDTTRERYPRVAEVPFDSDYKFMGTFHRMTDHDGRDVIRCFVKGAPDVLLGRAASFWTPDGTSTPIDDERRQTRQRRERPHRRQGRTGDGRRPPRLRSGDVPTGGPPPRRHPRPDAAGDGRHRRSTPSGGEGGDRAVPPRRHRRAHDHRRPRRDCGRHRSRARHPRQGSDRDRVRRDERRAARRRARRDRCRRPRLTGGQDPPGRHAASAVQHRRHDR